MKLQLNLKSPVLLIVAACCVTMASKASAVPADYTFNLIVEAHCESQTDVCGATSEQDFRDAARQSVYDLNLIWRPTGISFQLKSVSVSYGDSYLSVTDDSLDAGEAANLALLNGLRTKAKNDPDNVYWFVLQNLSFCFSGVPGSHLGRTPNAAMPDEYFGVFCSGVDGQTMAHEIGHHFCLAHPFTQQDSTAAAAANHDGDGLSDTPDDPGEVEFSFTANAQTVQDAADVVYNGGSCNRDPETCAHKINANREWCAYDMFPTDAGSVFGNFCVPRCRKSSANGVSATSFAPSMELIMSYYKHDCRGPFVYQFVPYEAFSPMEIQQMRECYTKGSERGQLEDVCAAKGGDSDWDGICDDDDPCPAVRASIWDLDADSDGIPDACDPCPNVPAVDADNDGDGIDDACDPNDDNDACNDDVDDNPLLARIPVGTMLTPGCSKTSHTLTASESGDHDNDGIPDCRDDDNDNDGKMDKDDPCPNSPEDNCVFPGESCGMTVPWDSCIGGGCVIDILARLESIRNPGDPLVEFPVRLSEDRLYLLPVAGHTAGEIRGAVTGRAFGMVEGAEKIRMTLVENGTGKLVADVGTYKIGNVRLAGGNRGNVFEIAFAGVETPVAGLQYAAAAEAAEQYVVLDAALTWGIGIHAEDELADTDSDGIPDVADNCVNAANPFQTDTDGDRIGNMCDPDFDGDGIVSESDKTRLESCNGISVKDVPFFREPGQQAGPADTAGLNVRAILCRIADLDEDGDVDDADNAVLVDMIGRRPGPSGLIPSTGSVDPNPDQPPETAEQTGDAAITDIPGADMISADTSPGSDEQNTGGSDGCNAGPHGSSNAVSVLMLIAMIMFAGFRRRRA